MTTTMLGKITSYHEATCKGSVLLPDGRLYEFHSTMFGSTPTRFPRIREIVKVTLDYGFDDVGEKVLSVRPATSVTDEEMDRAEQDLNQAQEEYNRADAKLRAATRTYDYVMTVRYPEQEDEMRDSRSE